MSDIRMDVRGLGKVIYTYVALLYALQKRILTAESAGHSQEAKYMWQSLEKRGLAQKNDRNAYSFIDLQNIFSRREIKSFIQLFPIRIVEK